MRKIIVLSFISLDGVMQAPGGPEEDTSGGFKYGGWVTPYFDEASGKIMEKQLKPSDYLLGRKTFDSSLLTGLNIMTFGQVSMKVLNTSYPTPRKRQVGKTQFSLQA